MVVAHDGFLCAMKIVHIFPNGYFDYRGVFQIVLDLYWVEHSANGNGCFTFETIIGTHSNILSFDAEYMDSQVNIIFKSEQTSIQKIRNFQRP